MTQAVADLATARLYWQTGNWDKLAELQVETPAKGSISRDQVELLLYKMQGHFGTGALAEGRGLAKALSQGGVSRRLLIAALSSGVRSSLARGWMLAGNNRRANDAIKSAISSNTWCDNPSEIFEMRARHEWSRVRQSMQEESASTASQRKLFIDCGGFDGCSALKFLLSFPEFDAITFEPNPDLWRYYAELPTQLVKKAVHTYDGLVSFRIDTVDGDGSSLVDSKTVDFHNKVSNEESPLINVPCVDLSAFVARKAIEYDRIILKLDIEGAEYDILEKMLEDGTLHMVDQVYCEFHHDKIDIAPERHHAILERARMVTRVEPWDANYSVFNLAPKDRDEQVLIRKRIVKDILRVKRSMLKLVW